MTSQTNQMRSGPYAGLRERERRDPSQPVLVFDGEPWSVGQILTWTDRLFAGLHRCGVSPGDRLAIHLANCPQAVCAYLACERLGAVAVPLNTRSATRELIDVIERTEPVMYLGEQAVYSSFSPVPADLIADSGRFLIDGPAADTAAGGWEDLLSDGEPPPDVESDIDEPAILLATSGTTGPSKIVVWSHRTLANLNLSAPGRHIFEGGVLPILTPLMHGSGIYFLFNAFTQGALPVLMRGFESAAVLDAIERQGVTGVFGLPFMFDALIREQRFRPRDTRSLETAAVAGDTCPTLVETEFAQVFGLPLRSFWAATEDVGATVVAPKVGPYMQVLEETTVRVEGEDGGLVAPGEIGELVVRSPTTSPGYWDARRGLVPMPGGEFRTGDLVRDEGPRLLRYVGRQKDLIVRGGSNISPTEVEELLRTHPAVVDAGVAGVPVVTLGQRVGALLVLDRSQIDGRRSDIVGWLAERLAAYKLPEYIAVVDTIPRNALTKVDRVAIVEVLRNAVEVESPWNTRPGTGL